MKTVSTLCATGTIGVAACGLTFGQPVDMTMSSSHIQVPLSDISSSHRASPVSFPSSVTGSRSGGRSPTNLTTSSQETTTPASSSTAGTKRKWYRRLSEAALKRRSVTPPESSTASSFTDLARRLSVGIKHRSRSNTLKSLARSNSHKAPITLSAPENIDRPATIGPSFTLYGTQSLSNPSGSSLPFSFQSSVHSSTYQPEHIHDWEFYLQPRRVQFTGGPGNMSPPRSPVVNWIKRIFPSTRWQPTLVKPCDISQGPQELPEIDIEDQRDIRLSYDSSRAPSPATSSAGGRSRRSLSISGFLSTSTKFGPGPTTRKRRRLSIIPSATYDPPGSSEGFPSIQMPTRPDAYHFSQNATVRLIPNEMSPNLSPNSPLTPIAPPQAMLPTAMDLDQPQEEDYSHARRPSLLVSERASTLIGSDDIEQDFLSDTVFDSLRTRASPTHAPKLDTLFNGGEQSSSRGIPGTLEPSPIILDEPMQGFSLNQSTWSVNEEPFTGLTPSNTRPQTRSHPVSPFTTVFKPDGDKAKSIEDDDSVIRKLEDDIANALKRNSKERPVHSTFPRRRPHARNSSNLDTFDVGRKSMDAPSVEGDRVVSGSDWSESVAKSGRSSREIASSDNSKSRQRAPSAHTRSRSMPVAGVFADSSENWDDDFDNDFSGDVIIPKSIKDAQATVMGHLGNVREFAKQVENLKKLVEKANMRGVRNGPFSALWDDAEGIITLATVDDDVPMSAIADSGTPTADSFDLASNASQENIHLPRPLRRASVLLPDDDIFGTDLFHSRNTTPRLPQEPFLASKSSSPALVKDEKKAVTSAKSIVARVQQRELPEKKSKERLVPSPLQTSKAPTPEARMKFDTTSLQELVAHVKGLIRQLEEALEAVTEVPKLQAESTKPENKLSEEDILLQAALFNYQDILPAFLEEEEEYNNYNNNRAVTVPVDALLDLTLSEKSSSITNTSIDSPVEKEPACEVLQKGRARSGTNSRRRRSTLMTFV
ncbi:hypothetical protein EYR41_005461 [Orbilia oligospora]|uniref:Uncharacterized protein n=1 Tax=Orbilia oligospora TaxID=2813651 RepID=A0A7C8P3S9_ORBOL|nr:hypothetical protein TWF751_001198 [Orbilia oligospora]KAF3258524.1 hypothetical protein TWF128_004753 [Orbilia oligospora]TGJ69415.1 hypothetical protein EYR41_005461 [Orbilia oligospora]